MALPLAGHPLIRADNFEETQRALTCSWRPLHIECLGTSSRMDFRLNGVPMPRMSVTAMTFGNEIATDVGEFGMYS
ncbi:hypothetical protein, partial [Phytoactinopolyspora endophytica]|uniref:hypothetical protein n=1 Tax=Phytoactinopolyspora endophytica TaxID=1642495 RepID=UPI0013EBEE5A